MANAKEKVKNAIDQAAKEGKNLTDKAATKATKATKKVGDAVENTGAKIKKIAK